MSACQHVAPRLKCELGLSGNRAATRLVHVDPGRPVQLVVRAGGDQRQPALVIGKSHRLSSESRGSVQDRFALIDNLFVLARGEGMSDTQVLIAGGGPVGLAAAVELGQRGIECVVIEPRATVSHARPRCKTINVRSMEHLRRWGIADRLRERAPLPVAWSQDIVFCTSLTGYELSRFSGVLGLSPETGRCPEPGQQAPQYVLEELLREVADELPSVTLATGRRVTRLEQDEGEVRVAVADAAGPDRVIAAAYVLGCDGPRSVVRDAIGAAYVGEHALRPNFGMVFHAPELLERTVHGPAVQYWILNRVAPALMGPIDLNGTWWIIAFGVDRATGERDARALIDGSAGTLVEASVLSHDPWTARMQLVDRARDRRVFLAGDAAHLNPPFGGHGLNTGIGDAVDIGWKLAAVLEGWGGSGLLDSYEAERRPIQTRVIASAAANNRVLATDLLDDDADAAGEVGERARRVAHTNIQTAKRAEFHALSLVLDLAYEQSPVIAADGPGPALGDDDDPACEARSGARLPHVWLEPGRSLYDELGSGLTLLVLGDDCTRAFERAARERGVPLRVVALDAALRDRYRAGLILVRPDQHVAWCADRMPDDTGRVIDQVRGADPTGGE
jgi:2-polyprenyl-6-methoxyphenol hydroxylase-like FAD-dependent oxidoreductase